MVDKRSAPHRLTPLLVAVAGMTFLPDAHANLNNVPDMTPVQAPTAAVIQSICAPINARTNAGLNTPEQALLGVSCRKMVQTSNAQQGSGPTPNNLGLTQEQLRQAIQGVAPEEMNAAFNQARTVTAAAPISARLLALRGIPGAGALASSVINLNGQPVQTADLLPAGSRGGGASSDSAMGGRLSGFLTGHYNWGDRDASALEDAFDFTDYGFTGGVDYRFTDAIVGGLALSVAKTDADFDHNLGSVESDNWGLSMYGSYSRDGFHVDGFLGYSKLDFDTKRRILVVSTTAVPGFDTTAKGSTDAGQFTASVGGGYDWVSGDMTLSPYIHLNYLHLKVDGFTESEPLSALGLTIKDHSVTSLQSAIGGQISKTISTSKGVIAPYAALEWNHEFRNDDGSIVAKYAADPFNQSFAIPTSKPDRDFFTARAGVSATFPRGISAFANIQSVFGLHDTTNTGVTLGARMEF